MHVATFPVTCTQIICGWADVDLDLLQLLALLQQLLQDILPEATAPVN
jgi:hypothetical protein